MSADRRKTGVEVREATADDRLDVRRILDAAMLAVRDDLPARIEAEDVLVASGRDAQTPSGALVLVPENDPNSTDSAHVDAIAVRRARRGRGIGTALVRAAAERHDRLTAEFDPSVRPFYESLGFDVEPADTDTDDRLRGTYEAQG